MCPTTRPASARPVGRPSNRRLLTLLCLPLWLATGCEEGPPPDLSGVPADELTDRGPSADGGVEDRPDAAPDDTPDTRPPDRPDAAAPAPDAAPDPVVLTVHLDVEGLELDVGEVTALAAEVRDAAGEPVDADVTWHSDDPRVARADARGLLLGISAGTARVWAAVGDAESRPALVTVERGDPQGPSWSAVVEPFFRGRCATAGCHVDGVEPGDLRFDRDPEDVWEELVDDASEQTGRPRVTPGDAGASYLIDKLVFDRPDVGARMPLGQPPLSTDALQMIVLWIAAGAEP